MFNKWGGGGGGGGGSAPPLSKVGGQLPPPCPPFSYTTALQVLYKRGSFISAARLRCRTVFTSEDLYRLT